MADNTVLNNGTGGDTIRDLARQAGTIKTQVVQIDIGGASSNAELLVTGGQQNSANSLPVVIANNQSAINISAMSAQTDSTGVTGTLSGTGQQTVTALNGLSEVNFNVQGAWVANAVLEASLDGTTFTRFLALMLPRAQSYLQVVLSLQTAILKSTLVAFNKRVSV